MSSSGLLYIVATPLGNLGDISTRAKDILSKVALIAAEDTRHSKKLLNAYQITTPLLSLHEHNEQSRIERILEVLEQGKSVALISDAGTPLISDPGEHLVKAVIETGFTVCPIPGPCALIAALSASGLSSKYFYFEGFLPVKSSSRCERLETLANMNATLGFYEAPHRILSTLEDMVKIFGCSRRAVIAREMTKLYETFLHGSLEELFSKVQNNKEQQQGEIVILVEGYFEPKTELDSQVEDILTILLKELPLKQAVKLTAEITGEKRNFIYELALKLQS